MRCCRSRTRRASSTSPAGSRISGIEIISTGGTAAALSDAGIPVRGIDDLTGFPEIMDGRVKTLHPKLYAGLLAVRDNPEHARQAQEHDVEYVDLVVVNLYPFERTAARRGVLDSEVIENIDIGGPTMIRAAAKNHAFAAPVVGPESYDAVLDELRQTDLHLSPGTREWLAAEAFRLHRALRHRDRALVPGEARGLPVAVRARVREGARAALRREPAPARRLLRAGRRPHPRALDGLPAGRQGDLVQQSARPRLRPAACSPSSRSPRA